MTHRKAALVILDGWGIGDGGKGDAIAHARVPYYRHLLKSHPSSKLKTYGMYVGLPDGQMGNSEVGHMNIGAGRVVYQDLTRINLAINEGELAQNKLLIKHLDKAKREGISVHWLGLVSHGGVHSSLEHLKALIDVAEKIGIAKSFVHAFTDGRDTEPRIADACIAELSAHLKGKESKLVSMIGRYFAMDRDKRWDRIRKAYDLLVSGTGKQCGSFEGECQSFYNQGITDEFFEPVLIKGGEGRIGPGDLVVFFNFRTDRCRQLLTALCLQPLEEHGMKPLELDVVTMTRYDESFTGVDVLFEKDNLENTIGEVIESAGNTQLRIAETEKYPHVTFFFSGGREKPFRGESRILVHSPKVATYDLQPEMSAEELTDKAISAIDSTLPDFVCLNYANPDMVGHTGVFDAVVRALEKVDHCLNLLVQCLMRNQYAVIIIADHGNADQMLQADGTPHTAHTMNMVPCILVSDGEKSLSDGILADVAPTLLDLMGLKKPADMTGRSLVK